jgi:hypothetical protein
MDVGTMPSTIARQVHWLRPNTVGFPLNRAAARWKAVPVTLILFCIYITERTEFQYLAASPAPRTSQGSDRLRTSRYHPGSEHVHTRIFAILSTPGDIRLSAGNSANMSKSPLARQQPPFFTFPFNLPVLLGASLIRSTLGRACSRGHAYFFRSILLNMSGFQPVSHKPGYLSGF